MNSKTLTRQDYSVGWICALPKELAAAMVMLHKEHPALPTPVTNQNTYTLRSIGDHHVVIAYLPKGDISNNLAATAATRMVSSFPSIKF